MCRDLDTDNLKGIFYDNACNFHTYLLGREPREWEYLRCLVDGMHFRGHKKQQKRSVSLAVPAQSMLTYIKYISAEAVVAATSDVAKATMDLPTSPTSTKTSTQKVESRCTAS